MRVLSISEVRAASHSVSLVHISSIWLSAHSCPMVSSPLTEGKAHPFGVFWAIPLWRVFHVWIGRFSSVTVSPFACKTRLHMSHQLDLFFLNLLVKAFTGKLFVIIL